MGVLLTKTFLHMFKTFVKVKQQTKQFIYRNRNNISLVQDSQYQMYQLVCWDPYGAAWKSEDGLENKEFRDQTSL